MTGPTLAARRTGTIGTAAFRVTTTPKGAAIEAMNRSNAYQLQWTAPCAEILEKFIAMTRPIQSYPVSAALSSATGSSPDGPRHVAACPVAGETRCRTSARE